ncbi:hypothetical protein V8B55DRAFT_1458814 [Mucor lusitanicus]|uniref:Uncharacterized protein n=2 Tax=Mucor circinelloides f. lusitanicus TaxID=29924 RepID=A0A162T6N5_MUCCL|nr:hypothetical protein FB192DRAFT_1338109 [Mucor lusitanicus]OAD02322.1 hypothetical protein MUCCIDRAFT_164253 [Mucor lusitanicus CBS 277.49]
MSTPQPSQNVPDERMPRWQFRKKKKLEKRRKQRQKCAEKNKPADIPIAKEAEELSSAIALAEKEKYEQDKRHWEEREGRFKLVELAKKKAREKEERAKALTQKRWQDTLMTLPMLPPTFSIGASKDMEKTTTKPGPFKTFVKPKDTSSIRYKKTYRDRFLERKLSKQ